MPAASALSWLINVQWCRRSFTEIVLASRTYSKCEAIAESVKEKTGREIQTAEVDADNVPELVLLLNKYSPELVINVALPYQDLHIMDACLEVGCHYLDTANYEPPDVAKFEYKWQWEYQQRFKDAGLCALLGSGFDPGVTNVFTAWALKNELDEISELDIIDVNGGVHGQHFATNFNPEINIREVTANCRHWKDGQFIETPPMSAKKTYTCPEDVGTYQLYRLYHEELESLTKHIPTIKKAQFWMSFSENYLKHLEVLQNVGHDQNRSHRLRRQRDNSFTVFKSCPPGSWRSWQNDERPDMHRQYHQRQQRRQRENRLCVQYL